MSRSPWELESTNQVYCMPCEVMCVCRRKNIYLQKGHALRVVFTCRRCRRKRSWSSSRVFANHYLVNQKLVVYGHHIKWCSSCRLVHSFTCAGKLPVQYSKFSRFAGLGVLGTSYLSHGNFWSKFSEFLHVECLHCTQCIGRVATSSWCRKWQVSEYHVWLFTRW